MGGGHLDLVGSELVQPGSKKRYQYWPPRGARAFDHVVSQGAVLFQKSEPSFEVA